MKALLFTFFISTLASAQVSQVNIRNFNFYYTAPSGEGTAEAFTYEQKFFETQKVQIEKNGNDFDI